MSSCESSESVIDLGGNPELNSAQEYLPKYANEMITRLNLNSLSGERAWRKCKSKEELSQYFNYGFDEITFRLY